MGLLDDLMGGGGRQDEYRDFVSRYEQGAPYEGISDDEAFQRHDEIAQNLSQDEYQQAAYDAFDRMSPEDRMQVGDELAGRARDQGFDLPGLDDARTGDPGVLSQLVGQLHGQNPSMLSSLLGGGGGMGGMGGMGGGGMGPGNLGGGLGSMLGGGGGGLGGMLGGGMGGGGMGGGMGGMLGGGAKGALAGIAAQAAMRMLR